MHLGNARTFLIAWLRARVAGGKIILRMEDLDHPKVKPNAAAEALEDLHWLGLDWDEGPDIGGPFAPYTQTQRIEHYAAALKTLREKNLAYPCVCSRKDVTEGQSAPHGSEDGLYYPGTCRGRFADFESATDALNMEGACPHAPHRIPAWRFKVAQGSEVVFDDVFHGAQHQRVDEAVGDFVIARHADGAGYMLAVVVDDAAMGVTEVVRGDDLLSATPRQLLLHRALGLREPAFMHVPLVVAEDGRRLAKRHGDTRLRALRDAGIPPEEILGLLAWWSGWAKWDEALSLPELLRRYDPAAIPRAPAVLTGQVKKRLLLQRGTGF